MKKNKIIQVPMTEDLVGDLDALSREQDRSRASLIREACAEYIANAEEADKVRRYIDAYERFPEDAEEFADLRRAAIEAMEPEDFSDWLK